MWVNNNTDSTLPYFCTMQLSHQQLYEFLEEKASFYNNTRFIDTDPISIPHLFTRKEDIEIAGFLAATLAWGQRVTIISKSRELMNRMDNTPFDFVRHASGKEISTFSTFIHRTFQGDDCISFLHALQQIYLQHGGLENAFVLGYQPHNSIQQAISGFRELFFSQPHLPRARKHLPDPVNGSAAKRINMFLRWMVRQDQHGVDFGIWKNIHASDLLCPLDLHSGNVARSLRLLQRKTNDWQAVEELTARLRAFDPLDPVKYDFALFGSGINENKHT